MASEVVSTIWQGGQLATPVRTTLAKVKTILGADYTLGAEGKKSYLLLCAFVLFICL